MKQIQKNLYIAEQEEKSKAESGEVNISIDSKWLKVKQLTIRPLFNPLT